ncbi:zeta toxin family protein [Methylobacterium sp. J-068]|uniref:zeta toxin family protein n=1 Tax=Methylobacterium sp. J-068 TaxID=2836649 RepID=UPI001FBB4210|nr:zeta toxin family protein [Methylobacterium sp. J-068]MCJ2033995.1 zeta toxin family protein [Methylobacterium sp. J-068]
MDARALPARPCRDSAYGPWNPGLESSLPRAILPLATVFRPEHVETSLGQAFEMGDVSGLSPTQLVRFRAGRLVVHEVLIRVMADFSVPVGQTYGDLGVNFRAIVAAILRGGIAAHAASLDAHLAAIRARSDALLAVEIAAMLGEPQSSVGTAPSRPRGWASLFRRRRPDSPRRLPADPETRAERHLADWQQRATASGDPLDLAACAALRSVVASLIGRRGFLIRDKDLLTVLAGTLVSNGYGSQALGEMIEPWVQEVVDREGFVRLNPQASPVIMNVKGSSASGKSTIRPYQRALTQALGLDWSDFALITPDVWRKFLLDYDSLGEARRYAGPLTGHEVEIVDRKLDGYMARKADACRISHLLIDRFRFDSFTVNPGTEMGGQLLTRFGHQVYMQFMITPPDATVERAWKRGEQFGRYKAVEDLLAHNVEAYTGMPRLFFTWVLRPDKEVYFEFLDNSVPEGERPRTIAYGANGVMNILDVGFLFDIDRYRAINIQAQCPDDVYLGVPARDAPGDMRFLRDCVRRMTTIRFADHATGRVLARLDQGRLTSLALEGIDGGVIGGVLTALGLRPTAPVADAGEVLRRRDARTLGAWGQAVSS